MVAVKKGSCDWNRRIESHSNSETSTIISTTNNVTLTLRGNSKKTVITKNTIQECSYYYRHTHIANVADEREGL